MIHMTYGQEIMDISRNPRRSLTGFYYDEKDDEDYEKELRNYIAMPAENGYYEFLIDSIRPNECLWIQPGMLIYTDGDEVTMDYAITSKSSAGNIRGTMKINIKKPNTAMEAPNSEM